ncbi:hypothetical protein [Streptomyces zagrosensis]|uniref:Uncharacterized protein n=1 Tax=Streptomyces zagrosensis TaxID=1042984 RepID=A0A7W9QFN5_9ACTN|nr:hypothetical protein [Streptomyces zagrosensis]MBB5939261.1 hypothetical protein [Streptomyces zagrosensis]
MSERDVDARVEELTRGLRQMAAGLLEASAKHPDAVRARELSVAARLLTNDVLTCLDGEAVTGSQARRSEPDVQDADPSMRSTVAGSGSALEELVELYLNDYDRSLHGDPVMIAPDLRHGGWEHLHRVKFGRGKPFEGAPLWNDTVSSRGKTVVRGMTSKREVLRRLHHSYVTRRDLDGPEGELAVRILQGCEAIRRCRVINDGDFVKTSALEVKLMDLKWRALVIAAGRSEHAGAQLLTRLRQLEVLAAAVLKLDAAFRQHNNDPSMGTRIAGAAYGLKALLHHWPLEESVADSCHFAP